MADVLRLESNAQELMQRYARLPANVRGAIRRGLKRGLILAGERVRANTRIRARHGMAGLMGRLASFAREDGTGSFVWCEGAIGFRKRRGFPYELAQEYGARARPGGAMAMPVSPMARRLSMQGIGPREFPRELFKPPHMRVLAERSKRGGGLKAIHYVFLKSLKPRLGFRRAVIESLPQIADEVSGEAQAEIEKA